MSKKMTLGKLAGMLRRGFARTATRMETRKGLKNIIGRLDKIDKHLAKIEAVLTL